MNKNGLKYLIDVTMFIDICSITFIGLIMGFAAPGGSTGAKTFMGLHRHDWGDIHLFLSFFFVFLLVVHVILNWAWVKNTTKRYFGDNWQKALYGFAAGWILIVGVAWLALLIA